MNTLQERLRANVMTHSRALYTAAADRIAALEAENAALMAVLKKARNEVAYMASGMTHAAWKTEQAQQVLTAIDAAIARSKT